DPAVLALRPRFQADGSSLLAPGLRLTVWPVAAAAACTESTPVPATGTQQGFWHTGVLTDPVPLAGGASQRYCLRSWVDGSADSATGDQHREVALPEVADPGGTRSMVPRAQVLATLGGSDVASPAAVAS